MSGVTFNKFVTAPTRRTSAVTILACATGVLLYAQRRRILTYYLAKSRLDLSVYGRVRPCLQQIPMDEVTAVPAHSHGKAAALRNAFPLFAVLLGLETGLTPFFVQQCRADQKAGYKGSLSYYWVKEAHLNPSGETPDERDLVAMNDVDYYVDMPRQLLANPRPHLISTIEPTTAGGPITDGVFRFIDNEIEMRVSGGALYRHRLWNYGSDQVGVSGWAWDGLLPVYRYVGYQVERRSAGLHRSYVLLTPNVMYTWAAAVMARLWLSAYHLQRLSPLQGAYNVINVLQGDKRTMSVSRNGAYTSATIDLELGEVLRSLARQHKDRKLGLPVGSVESLLEYTDSERKNKATLLAEYYRETEGMNDGPFIYPVDYAVQRYQYAGSLDVDAKPSLKPFGAPLVGPTPAPDVCKANDDRTVLARVNRVKTQPLSVNRFVANAMTLFLEYVIPVPHECVPWSSIDVAARQPRPSQQRIWKIADLIGNFYQKTGKAFQKREAYGKINDPRNITTIPGREKIEYSRFVYSFSELLKKQKWYAFSKTPTEVARRVVHICRESEFVFEGDLSRMDGRVSTVGRLLTRAAMKRAFVPAYHDELDSLMSTQIHKTCVTRFGVRYQSGTSRLSGSPETSAFNTLENAFMAYLAFRFSGLSHDESTQSMEEQGFFGGDDSLVGDLPQEGYVKAARYLGHVATGEVKHRGDYVTFLARYYSRQVWGGRLDSCTDIARAVSKFMCAANLPDTISPASKLYEKSTSVVTTDRNTPILGDLARRVLDFPCPGKSAGDTSWWSQFGSEVQFPNDNHDGWMDELCAIQLPEFDLATFRETVTKANGHEELLALPLCMLNPMQASLPPGTVTFEEVADSQEEKLESHNNDALQVVFKGTVSTGTMSEPWIASAGQEAVAALAELANMTLITGKMPRKRGKRRKC